MAKQLWSRYVLDFFQKCLYFGVLSLFFILVFKNFVWGVWVDADGVGQESIDISNSAGDSELPSVCLDSSGNPNLVWEDNSSGNYDIYYLKWNGTEWVDADGSGQGSVNISNNIGSSKYSSICLDSSGKPHIAWYDYSTGNDEIYYLWWNGAAWVDADGSGQGSINISTNSSGSLYPSLRLDSAGNPHIAWKNYHVPGSNYEIYYLWWNGAAWVDADGSGQESINISSNTGYSGFPSLRLDSSGNPHIAWWDHSSGKYDIYYLKWNGTEWVDADGSGRGSVNISDSGENRNPSLYLDNSGNPHIAWDHYVSGNYEIYYLKWNGAEWVDADGSGQGSINISKNKGDSGFPSLCLDGSGNPHIAWSDYTIGKEIYYLRWNGTEWVDVDGSEQESINISHTSGDSRSPSLYLGSSGNPHIAWRDDTSGNYDIYYLKWNNAPVLSWTGETNYNDDGLDPEFGFRHTEFVYRVKYRDKDNDFPAPGYPKVHIMKAGLDIEGSPFSLSEVDPVDKDCSDGKLYTYTKSGLIPGTDYTYYFEAKDLWNTRATGPPTNPLDAPDVMNNAPVLSWTGETNYINDGLDPEVGLRDGDFIYRVKYADEDDDGPLSGYPRVHILKSGIEIEGSPFSLSEVDPGDKDYSDGKLYTYTKSGLTPGTDYTYYFEAKDLWNTPATGTPTDPVDAPDVPNNAPTLSWTGETNYINDGLDPEVGLRDGDFIYRVKYADQDNDGPLSGYPRVHILKSGIEIEGSPFSLSEVDPGDKNYTDGKLYTYTKSGLTPGTDYTYYFEAKDFWNTPATGPPTNPLDAPDVPNNAPTLSWTGEANYINDGLDPEVAPRDANFIYRVKYTDQDNDASLSGYPRVHILKSGIEIEGSPFSLSEVDPGDKNYGDGKLYSYTKSGLISGTDYTYYFEANDLWSTMATGEPTNPRIGPEVRIRPSAKGGVKIQGGENGYVNPLKGEVAKIHFWPSGPGIVDVEIFNLIGLLVWEKSRDVSGSEDIIEWDCTNTENDLVASGIYVVYVEGPGIRATKKVAVVK